MRSLQQNHFWFFSPTWTERGSKLRVLECALFHIYWDFRIKFCCVKKRFGFYFDQSERRNEFLTRKKIVSSNHKPRFKRIVFSRAFAGGFVGQLWQDNIFGVLELFVIQTYQELEGIFEDNWTIKKICVSRETYRQVYRRPKKQEHSFKDTKRCKFADWVSQLQKWKQKNRGNPAKRA